MENEYQTYQREHDDMAGSDGHKKSHRKWKRFSKDAQYLHRHNYKFQGQWHPGSPEDVLPVVLIATHVSDDESEQGKNQRDGDITGKVGRTWQ